VPSPAYRQLRHLTQLRDVLVSELAGMKQRIKALLLFEGIEFPTPPPGSQWSFLVKDKLRKLPCSGTVRFKLDQLLDSLEFNEKQVLKTITEIRRFCRNDPELSQCMKYDVASRHRLDYRQPALGPHRRLARAEEHPS